MTDAELGTIEARVAAATAGPWVLHRNEDDCGEYEYFVANTADIHVTNCGTGRQARKDAAFLCAAKTDVPLLVKALREERAIIHDLRQDSATYRRGLLDAAKLAWARSEDYAELGCHLPSAEAFQARAKGRALAELAANLELLASGEGGA